MNAPIRYSLIKFFSISGLALFVMLPSCLAQFTFPTAGGGATRKITALNSKDKELDGPNLGQWSDPINGEQSGKNGVATDSAKQDSTVTDSEIIGSGDAQASGIAGVGGASSSSKFDVVFKVSSPVTYTYSATGTFTPSSLGTFSSVRVQISGPNLYLNGTVHPKRITLKPGIYTITAYCIVGATSGEASGSWQFSLKR